MMLPSDFDWTAISSSVRLQIQSCETLWEQMRCKEALQALPACSEDPAEEAELLALRARLRNELGDHADALRISWQALERDARHPRARFAQGYALLMLNQLEEAEVVLTALLRDAPDYPDASWLYAGVLRQRQGELAPKARAAYQRALALDPDNLYIAVEYADLLRANGAYEEAAGLYARCQDAQACPDEALRVEASFKTGLVEMVLGRTEAARNAFRAVLEIAPDYPDAQAMYEMVADAPPQLSPE